jgi:26S proteasome regulatory subunit T1
MGAPETEPDDKAAKTLDADDIRFLKTYGLAPYSTIIKTIEQDIKDIQKRVIETIGIKESDTGLAPPSRWDLVSDKQMLYEEHPLQVRFRPAVVDTA